MKDKQSLNIIFLTISRIRDMEESGIYTDLLRKFRDKGHCVTIVSPIERRFEGETQLIKESGVQFLNVRTLNIQKTHFVEKGLGTILLEYQYIRAIKKYLSNIKFDLILYATPPITLVKPIQFLKKRDGAFAYLMLKDIFPQNAVDLGMFSKQSLFYRFFRRKEKGLYIISDYIGCMSPANVDYVLKYNLEITKEKVGLCPNAVDLTRIPKYVPKERSKPLRFIYGGNLGKPQGLDFLLQIIDYYKNSSEIEFFIVGGGTEFSKLRSWFDEHRPQNAYLKSQLPKNEYEKLVNTADIGMIFLDKCFTIPNYPSRLLSYLQNGIPVFCAVDSATDIGEIAEENKFGIACKHGNLKEAIEKINFLLTCKELNVMGENGYKFLKSNYSVDNVYSHIIKNIRYV